VIYVDTSVVLAHVLGEDSRPTAEFWASDNLVSSRLTEYEAWVRLNAYGRAETAGARLAATLGALHILALDDEVCGRCRAPFPTHVRTLDALHLATADYLRTRGFLPRIATYDRRMGDAAVAMGFQLFSDEQ
jgi:uncharacterized protein